MSFLRLIVEIIEIENHVYSIAKFLYLYHDYTHVGRLTIDKKFLIKFVAFGLVIFSILAYYNITINVVEPSNNSRTIESIQYSAVMNNSKVKFSEKTLVLWNNSIVKGNCRFGDTFFKPCGLTYDQMNQLIYVVDRESNNIAILDPNDQNVTSIIHGITEPSAVAVDKLDGNIYVSSFSTGSVFIINTTNQKVIGNISVGLCPDALSYDSSNGLLYVANFGSNNVTVIDGNHVVNNINVGLNPTSLVCDPSNGNIYVADWGSNNISVINTITSSVALNINVQDCPMAIIYDITNNYLYVADKGQSNVTVINGQNRVIGNISVERGPSRMALDPSSCLLYVSDNSASAISVINTSLGKTITNISSTGGGPMGIVYDQTNEEVFSASVFNNCIAVISTQQNKIIGTISLELNPEKLFLNPLNKNLYVTLSCYADLFSGINNKVYVINDSNLKSSSFNVGIGPFGAAVDPKDNRSYFTSMGSDNITVVNISNDAISGKINAGSPTFSALYDPLSCLLYVTDAFKPLINVLNLTTEKLQCNISVGYGPVDPILDRSNGYIYVANRLSSNVTIINGSTNRVIGNAVVGKRPEGLAFDPNLGKVFVTNCCSSNVSIINATNGKISGSIKVSPGPDALAFDTHSGLLFVVSNVGNVSIINPNNGSFLCSLEAGFLSLNVLFDPYNNNIYISSGESGTVTIISPEDNAPKLYAVNFVESGLPSGMTWSMIFNGVPKNSTTNLIEFFAVNGTYSYSVENVLGYFIHNYTPKIDVAGSNVTSQILFSKNVTTSSLSSVDKYVLTGAIVIAAIGISILTIRRKKQT